MAALLGATDRVQTLRICASVATQAIDSSHCSPQMLHMSSVGERHHDGLKQVVPFQRFSLNTGFLQKLRSVSRRPALGKS